VIRSQTQKGGSSDAFSTLTINSDSVMASHGCLQSTAETRTHDRGNDGLWRLFDLEQKILTALGQQGCFLCGFAAEESIKISDQTRRWKNWQNFRSFFSFM